MAVHNSHLPELNLNVPKKSKTSRPGDACQNAHVAQPDAEEDIFPVVGIGASAGGLSAFTKLLKTLPTDTGMAFILVQHLDSKHVSLLPELMRRATSIPVVEVSDGLRVEPNTVYVMPPNHSVALLHKVLHLMPRSDGLGLHLPINDLFISLAEDCQNKAIGVVLSGTASDGTLGILQITGYGRN
ncbi:MAG: hypothetical protein NMNS01_28860 [Nitrosomonas sp.]|nr:MAG: hypothetical protein NMNS01_28860 [Nitrosomonas sp.]